MTIKVGELARELGVPCEEVLEQLKKLYVDVEDEKSKVDEKVAALLRIKLGGSAPKKKEKPVKKLKKIVKKKTKAKEEAVEKEEKKEKTAAKKKTKAEIEEDLSEEKKTEKEKEPKAGLKKEGISKIEIKGRVALKEKVVPEPKKEKTEVKLTADELFKGSEAGRKKGKKGGSRVEIVKKGDFIPAKKPRKGKGAYRGASIEIIEKGGKGKQRGSNANVVPASSKPALRKDPQKVEVQLPVSVRTLAPQINLKPNAIIQYLMGKGTFANINQDLEEDIVCEIMSEFGYKFEISKTLESMEQELVDEDHEVGKKEASSRAPVVTFMGHVDHGKTSLLDYIRNAMVAKGEKGGITQHIGAYKVETEKGAVTFLDTPGHAAFTAMRARGANATDVVVLVVAADDGVMPQTKEAIDHARAAGVPIVVAINKCDLAGANPDRVRQELQQEGLASEDWGGETIMVEVSAHTGDGVDKLVEMLMLESEMLDLKANPELKARGVVIEGKKTPGQGVVATFLVQNGTLRPGDIVLCGSFYGKLKAMINDRGEKVTEALPATPVEVLGLQGVPSAGEEFFVVKDEKKAKTLAALKQDHGRKSKMAGNQRITLEDFHSLVVGGDIKELKIILKGDVQGSVEALQHSLDELATEEVKLSMTHSAVGNINESDVMLAVVSNAVIIGFHVKFEPAAQELAKSESVDVHVYDVIYEAIADVRAAMEGLLEPELKEVFQGRAQVKEIFSASKIGKVAGCAVLKGVIHRKDNIRIKRGEEIIHEGAIDALKRFKDDVKEVKEGFECGISIKNFTNVREKDIIEAYIIEKIARRLDGKK